MKLAVRLGQSVHPPATAAQFRMLQTGCVLLPVDVNDLVTLTSSCLVWYDRRMLLRWAVQLSALARTIRQPKEVLPLHCACHPALCFPSLCCGFTHCSVPHCAFRHCAVSISVLSLTMAFFRRALLHCCFPHCHCHCHCDHDVSIVLMALTLTVLTLLS